MVYVKMKNIAALQKVIGYGIVILSAHSGMSPMIVILGCVSGIFLSEVSDVWYKLIIEYQKAVKKERLVKVGKP